MAPSAGQKHSSASSDNVTSTGVPNTIVALMNDSGWGRSGTRRRSGTAIPANWPDRTRLAVKG